MSHDDVILGKLDFEIACDVCEDGEHYAEVVAFTSEPEPRQILVCGYGLWQLEQAVPLRTIEPIEGREDDD